VAKYIPLPDIIRTLAESADVGSRFSRLPWFLAGFGRVADVAQRRLKTRLLWNWLR
jgi:hypothetical protein